MLRDYKLFKYVVTYITKRHRRDAFGDADMGVPMYDDPVRIETAVIARNRMLAYAWVVTRYKISEDSDFYRDFKAELISEDPAPHVLIEIQH